MGRVGRHAILWLPLLATLLASPAWPASGALTWAPAIGLGGHLVPGRVTSVGGALGDPGEDAYVIRVVQEVGNAWRGSGTISFELPAVPDDDGALEAAFPVYGEATQLRVELATRDGRTLASRDFAIRELAEDEPFPVAVGAFPATPSARAVHLGPSDLPHNGAAYGSASSVWIGRAAAGLDAARWDALARWVLDGGCLVLFTGSEYLLLDAPRFRDLLPLDEPALTTHRDGTPYLTGRLREGARVARERDGYADIVVGRYGAGTVVLVARDAFRYGPSEFAEIAGLVPTPGSLSLADVASQILAEQPILHPSPWYAALLLAAGVFALAAVVLVQRSPVALPSRSRTPWLAVSFLLLAGVSWLLTGPTRVREDVYQTQVSVSVSSSRSPLAVTSSCTAVASASRRAESVRLDLDAAPLEPLPARFSEGTYDVAYAAGVAGVTVTSGARRTFGTQADAPPALQAWRTGDEGVRLRNGTGRRLADALLLHDGEALALDAIETDESMIYAGTSVLGLGAPGAPLDVLFAAVSRALHLGRGDWLIAGDVRETGAGRRQVTLWVAEVGRG